MYVCMYVYIYIYIYTHTLCNLGFRNSKGGCAFSLYLNAELNAFEPTPVSYPPSLVRLSQVKVLCFFPPIALHPCP